MTEIPMADRKAAFLALGGRWEPGWDAVMEFDPEFFDAFLALAAVPLRNGHLSPKVKALIGLAVDLSVTRLDAEGVRNHLRTALDAGASQGEIREAMQITAGVGILSCVVGLPVLTEELRKTGRGAEVPQGDLDSRRRASKAAFERDRGYWTPFWEDILRLDPDFFDAYLRLSSVPWKTGHLEPKAKEFIYIAVDAAVTLLHEPAVRVHIRNALGHGASAAELLELLQIVSALGGQSLRLGVPILIDEIARRNDG
ncbi:MAG: carboxymuconolactone decarboxylase family protein [Alphaproteobacteria bacterium]